MEVEDLSDADEDVVEAVVLTNLCAGQDGQLRCLGCRADGLAVPPSRDADHHADRDRRRHVDRQGQALVDAVHVEGPVGLGEHHGQQQEAGHGRRQGGADPADDRHRDDDREHEQHRCAQQQVLAMPGERQRDRRQAQGCEARAAPLPDAGDPGRSRRQAGLRR